MKIIKSGKNVVLLRDNLVSPLNVEFSTQQYIQDDIKGEIDAIQLYQAHIDEFEKLYASTKNPLYTKLIEVYRDIIDEEKTHIGELNAVLQLVSPKDKEMFTNGINEVSELLSKKTDKVSFNDDSEERTRGENNEPNVGKGTGLPYGLCKKYGIKLPEKATPQQAWSALKKKGITPAEVFSSLKNTGTTENATTNTEEKEINNIKQEIKEQVENEDIINSITIESIINQKESDIDSKQLLNNVKETINNPDFKNLEKNTQEQAVDELEQQYSDSLTYTQQRKDKALWFKGKDAKQRSFQAFAPSAYKVYEDLDWDQVSALYDYSKDDYDPINKLLRTGNVPSNVNREEIQNKVDLISSVMEKSVIDTDCWLQRGINIDGAEQFLGLTDMGYSLYDLRDDERQMHIVEDLTPREKGFMSCAASKGSGFDDSVILNIFVPKGTHGFYLAPISYFGGNMGAEPNMWNKEDNEDLQYDTGENEMLLDKGLKFSITKIEYTNGQFYIDLEVKNG